MDYPNSVPSAGLVDGKFVDESPLTGAPGSLIPASWGNGVTQELLNVIRSAGINPVEGLNNQLLTALRSNGLFVTAPQFDNDNSVATTAFVTRNGLQFSGFTSYADSAVLTASNIGGVSSFTSNTPITATLPATTGIAHASTMNIVNAGAGALTVSAAPGADTIKASNGMVGSVVLGVGEIAEFLKLESQWRLVGGTVSLKYTSLFSGMTGNPGYQKYSSGNIDQWGYGTTDANGEVFVTFPISFPTAFVSVVATHVGGDGAMVIMLAGTATKQGCRLKVRDMGGSVRPGWGITYFAKGY
ncbi:MULTISPECIES: phage tail protein [Pseudomonas]|uniref:Phage tail protein n=1 Tax=Pseudomonas wuhanensis TaxID=2954098 RepID=A0ABY9GP12_9PSED|nr:MULTISPECIES: phage tail protein [unclassified Pseudomonas]WLI11542.1 phage tail protein [Pseudomonas sp. FP603]WLI17383.1 phage tail protein [Pseudomonas sp. FP607]